MSKYDYSKRYHGNADFLSALYSQWGFVIARAYALDTHGDHHISMASREFQQDETMENRRTP